MSLQLTFSFLITRLRNVFTACDSIATYGQAWETKCLMFLLMFLSKEPNLTEPWALLGYIKLKEPRKAQKHFASYMNFCTTGKKGQK